MHSSRHNILALSIFLLCSACTVILGISILPITHGVQLIHENGTTESIRLPMRKGAELSNSFKIKVSLWLPLFHPTQFHITPDDCIESLVVNGVSVLQGPFCDYTQGRVFDFHAFLQPGNNTLEFSMVNRGGAASLRMRPSTHDAHILILILVLLIMVCFAAYLLVRVKKLGAVTSAILLLGIGLRLLYMWNTPFDVRGYDWEGHHDYTMYLLEHHSIPHPQDGWQFYQPPLGYAVYSLFMLPLTPLQQSVSPETQQQIASLLLSIITLCLGIAAFKQLFPKKADRPWFLLASLLLATFPSLVMTSARVNNDVLFLTFAFAWLYTLLRFVHRPQWSTWITVSIILGLGLLTKSTMLVPIIATFVWLPFATQIRWRGRVSMATACAGILLVLAGWFVIPRALNARDPDRMVVGNIRNLNGALHLENTLMSFLSFQPAEILRHPYADPWNDSERRQMFPEYWFKTAFFGEFDHGAYRRLLAQVILFLGLLTLPLIPIGIIVDLRRNRLLTALPLLITSAAQIAAHTALRIQAPFSSIQDFRYSLILLFPTLYFAVRGVTALHRWLQPVLRDMLIISAFLWTAFLVSLMIV